MMMRTKAFQLTNLHFTSNTAVITKVKVEVRDLNATRMMIKKRKVKSLLKKKMVK